jgi:peptide/nickel transport system ATP-binding protein
MLDEPTSTLDVTVRAGGLEVLATLQARFGLTYLFVSHDLALVHQIADTISVLRQRRLVEQGTVGQISEHPRGLHPRCRAAPKSVLRDSHPYPPGASQ